MLTVPLFQAGFAQPTTRQRQPRRRQKRGLRRAHNRKDSMPASGKVDRRIGWVGPLAVDLGWVVYWHIDGLRVGRLDNDVVFFADDMLLLGGLEAAGLFRLTPQPLNRIQDCGLLGRDRVAELVGPLQIVVQ